MSIAFDQFIIDLDLFELRRTETPVPLEPKALELLILLAKNRDRVVSKDEIFGKLWSDVIVTDASISTALAQARKALNDDGQQQKYLKTVRGKGFRFIADVTDISEQAIGPVALTQETDNSAEVAIRSDVSEQDSEPELQVESNRPVLAVLPFTQLGTADYLQAISEAIPAELISTISKLRWLRVIARGSSFRFSSTGYDANDLVSKLGANYMLTGSVELAGLSLKLCVELTDARSYHVLWSDHYDSSIEHVFETREKIARDIISVMELHVPLHEAQRLAHQPSECLDAWGHYHLAVRHMYRYNKRDIAVAEQHFREAVRIDPDFARAHAGLAYTEFTNYFQKFGQQNLDLHRAQSLQHAQTALSIDPLDPHCNLMMGRAKWLYQEAEAGLEYVDRAISLNPNYAFAYYNSATLNTVICDGEMADKHVETALSLSPLDPNLQSMWGTRALAAFVRDDLTAARSHIKKALSAPYPHLYVFVIAAVVFHQCGDAGSAKAQIEQIRKRGVGFSKHDFLAHYDFRDLARRKVLVEALTALGL